MNLMPVLPGRILQPKDVLLLTRVFQRIKTENRIAPSPEVERSFGRYLLEMFVRGLVLEDKLYNLGIVAAKARFQEPATPAANGPVQLPLRRVAIIEDEYLLAADIKKLFEQTGAIVLGPVGRESDAMALLEHNVPDLAILDLNLGSGPNFELADHLRNQSVPFCIVSGYCRSDMPTLPPGFERVAWLTKPVNREALLRATALTLAEPSRYWL